MQILAYTGCSERNFQLLQCVAIKHRYLLLSSYSGVPLQNCLYQHCAYEDGPVKQFNVFARIAISMQAGLFVVDDSTVPQVVDLLNLVLYRAHKPRTGHLQYGPDVERAHHGFHQHFYPGFYGGLWTAEGLDRVGLPDDTRSPLEASKDWAERASRMGWGCFQIWDQSTRNRPLLESPHQVVKSSVVTAPDRTSSHPWLGSSNEIWKSRLTVVIPHLGPDIRPLSVAVSCWLAQSIPVTVQIIDTGSDPQDLRRLRALETPTVEVHSLRWRGLPHRSCFAGLAYQLGYESCRTPYLLMTHNDVFPVASTVAEELVDRCQESSPVVGYRMSPRKTPRYRTMVGTVLTCFQVRAMDHIRLSFNHRWLQMVGCPEDVDWPDVEVPFNESLRFAGIAPELLGDTVVGVRQQTVHFDHIGGYTSAWIYHPERHQEMRKWADAATLEAERRCHAWRL